MLIIDSPSDNAYFNIASEEYLLGKYPKEDIFLLYVNAPSIIIGKFQNTLAEINLDYVNENNIKVVRRMSGAVLFIMMQETLIFPFIPYWGIMILWIFQPLPSRLFHY